MIVDIRTGNKIDICFQELEKNDIKKFGLTRKNGWFNWMHEINNENKRVFGMFVLGNTKKEILGAISIQEQQMDQYIFVSLMESSPQNRYSHSNRNYIGVGKNLLCFSVHYSFLVGFQGFVGLYAKRNYNEKYFQDLEGICTHEEDGKPFYAFFPDKSKELINRHMVGGIVICPN